MESTLNTLTSQFEHLIFHESTFFLPPSHFHFPSPNETFSTFSKFLNTWSIDMYVYTYRIDIYTLRLHQISSQCVTYFVSYVSVFQCFLCILHLNGKVLSLLQVLLKIPTNNINVTFEARTILVASFSGKRTHALEKQKHLENW